MPIDIVNSALKNKTSVPALAEHLAPDQDIQLRDRSYYQKFNNKNNPHDPTAPSAAQVDKVYNDGLKAQQMVNNGYYRPQFSSPMMAPFAGNFSQEEMRPLQQRAQKSQVPTMRDAFAPGGYQYVMNADRDAYESSWYAKPNADMPGGYEKVEKQPGWQNTPGKFVFEPDPSTNGMTKMAVLMPVTADACGRDVLSVFGPPEEYARNFFTSALGNIYSALPRLGENIGQVGKSVNNAIASVSNADYDIFDNPDAVIAYSDELVNNFSDAKNHDILKTALESQDKKKIVDAFNYLEQQLPAWKRSEMIEKRMPNRYNVANRVFNDMIDHFERLQTVTPDQYKNGAFDSWGSFVYNAAGVLADLAPQMTGAIGGAKLLGKAGSMIMGGFVGGAQAVGSTMEAMQDAGFDINAQAHVLPFVMTAMPLTEGLVSGGWMGRYLGEDILQNYKGVMKEVFKEAYAKGGGKLAAGEAAELGKKSLINFWNNPAFKDWVQKGYFTRELPVAMLEESAQENLEDFVYGGANLYLNMSRPDYYGDVINSGVNDLWGSDGVFNPAQMLETTVLTAFATGISDSMRAGATGRFKKGSKISQQEIAQSTWAANTAARGEMGIFLDLVKDESKKETNVFGSKKNLLSTMGANDIVIDPETAKKYDGYNMGKRQEDGSIVIDNMADANALNFLQKSMMYKDIAESYGLDGKTPNAQALHELIDVSGSLMSTEAIEAGVDMSDANAALADFEKNNTDKANYSEEQKTQYETLVQDKAQAQTNLDYYTKIEDGTQYSKAVNDATKEIMTTYSVAEQKTKEQMNTEKINLDNKKVFSNLKSQWDAVVNTKQNYGLLKGLMGSIEGVRSGIEEDNKVRLERLKNLSTMNYDEATKKNYEALETNVNTVTEGLKETLDIKDNKAFLGTVKAISGAVNAVLGNINNEIDKNYLHPEMIARMQNKYAGMYDSVMKRVAELKGSNVEAISGELDKIGLDDPTSVYFQNFIGKQEDHKTNPIYAALDAEKQAQVDDIISRAELPAMADQVEMAERTPFDTDNGAYTTKVQKKINELSKPVTTMDAYDRILDDMHQRFQDAADAVDPSKEGETGNNPFSQVQSTVINDILEGRRGMPYMEDGQMKETAPTDYIGLMDAFENSYDVASRLDGKQQFRDHSNAGEQEVVGKLADGAKQTELKAKINTMRALNDKFKQMAGITDLSSTEYQQHKKAMLLGSKVKNMDYVIAILNDGTEYVPKALIDQLHSFTLTEEVEKLKGKYDEKMLAAMAKTEGALMQIMDMAKKDKKLKDEAVRKKLLDPFARFKDWVNQQKASTSTTMASAVGYDGMYHRGNQSVYDVDALRYDAAQVDLSKFDNLPYVFQSTNKVVIERLQSYANMLVLMTSGTTMGSIMRQRAKINEKGNPSTYEQENCEDTLIGFMTGGNSILREIRDMSRDVESQYKVIDDLMILPGDYGTGKTQHVMARALEISRGTGMLASTTRMTFYAPSQDLVDTHRKTFGRDNDIDQFEMFSAMDKHKATAKGEHEVVIIDEGSLLTKADMESIRKIQQEADGDVRIIVLADLNQMKSTEEMDSDALKYPKVMLYGFKAPTLTEQFSTLSPIIKTNAAYWRSRASEKNMATGNNIPMGYSRQTAEGNMGVQYSTSEEAVVDSFLASKGKDKALIFENEEQYNRFMDKIGGDLKKALETRDSDIFFIHFDKNLPQRVIQGLRRKEVYIVPDYKTMRYHTTGMYKEANDYVALYTAVGRATQYLNINLGMGGEALSHMTDDPMQAAPIGDVNGMVDHLSNKVEKMRSDNEIRFAAMGVQKTTPTYAGENVPTDGTEKDKTDNKTMTLTIGGKMLDFGYSVKTTKNGENTKYRYTITLNIDGVSTKIGEAATSTEMDSPALRNAMAEAYDSWIIDHKEKASTTPSYGVKQGKKYSMGDIFQQGTVVKLYFKAGGNLEGVDIIQEDGTIEYISNLNLLIPIKTGNTDPQGAPVGAPTQTPTQTGKTTGNTGRRTTKAKDMTRVFTSQGDAWMGVKSVYVIPHFTTATGMEHEVNKHRAMQAFLMDNAAAYGLTMHLAWHDSIMAQTAQGYAEQKGVVTVELDTTDKAALLKFVNAKKHDAIKHGYVAEALREIKEALRQGQDISKVMESYSSLSCMALPMASPVGKTLTGVTVPVKADSASLEDNIKLINLNYGTAMKSSKLDEQAKADLDNQRQAQIALAKIRDYAMNNHDERGTVKGGVKVKGRGVKVEYNDKEKISILDFIDNADHNMVFFDIRNGISGTTDENGQQVALFRTNEGTDQRYEITIKAPFLDDDELVRSGRLKRLQGEDEEQLKKLTTTSEPFDSSRKDVAGIYQKWEQDVKSMNIYKLLMSNRQNLQTKHEGSHRFDLSSEYGKYFKFSKDGKNIDFAGDNLSERMDSLKAVMVRAYQGEWKESLYDFIDRTYDKDGNYKLAIAKDQFMYTNARRINTEHFFVTTDNIDEITADKKVEVKPVEQTQPTVKGKDKPKDARCQSDTADSYDTRTITYSHAQKIVETMLGLQFVRDNLHLINGRILYAGHSATGMVENQHMFLADTGEGIRFTTPFHETLHIVLNNILDPKQVKEHLAMAQRIAYKEEGKLYSGVRLEEWIASDFASRTTSHGRSKEATAWDKFKTFLKKLVNFIHGEKYQLDLDRQGLDNLYNDIESGRYRDAQLHESDYLLFEDEQSTITGDDIYENMDAIGRFLDLKDNIERIFPGNRGLLDVVVRRKQFVLNQDSMLGNKYDFENHTLKQSIDTVIADGVALSNECGAEKVEVRKDGQVTTKSVQAVAPEEYNYIYFPDSTMTRQESKEYAQSSYRTWYVNQKQNVSTIMEHLVPEYNPETGEVGRGKLYENQFSNDLDPYSDGFTSEMKLQLKTIPMVRMVDGKAYINSRTPEFVDPRLMTELIKRAGVNSYKYYEQGQAEGRPISHYDALSRAIDELVEAYGTEVDENGRYTNAVTQALKSFETRFLGNRYSTFYDESVTENNEYYPLMGIAESIYEELRPVRAAGQTMTAEQQERNTRAEHIVSFISTLASTGLSSVVTRNMKTTLRGGYNKGFSYATTEYDNNAFDDVVNKMKAKLDNKFTNGLLTNERTIKQLNKLIQVDANGNITVGRDGRPFITVDGDKHTFVFNANHDVADILSKFHVIRNLIGLTNAVLPDAAVKEFLKNGKFTNDMRGVSNKLMRRGQGDMVSKFGDDPQWFLAAFLANTIYTMKSQTELFDLNFTYEKDGQKQAYNAKDTMISHRKKIAELMGEDNKKSVAELIGELPFSGLISKYMKRIGATTSNGLDEQDDMTAAVVPSQFYTAIDVLASQVSAIRGDLAGHQLFRADGKKQNTLQMRNPINSLIDGSADMVSNILATVEANPELKTDSPLYDAEGNVLAPYLKTGRGAMALDHIGDFFGMERDFGDFKYGSTKLTPHDFVAQSINMFMNKARQTASIRQIIITPTMTISDSGKLYMMHHRFDATGYSEGMVRVYGKKNELLQLNYDMALDHVANEARKIDRRVELSRTAFFSLMADIKSVLGVDIPVPTVKRVARAKTVSMTDYVQLNGKLIKQAMDNLSPEQREQVLEMVRRSDLLKGADVKIDEKNGTFSMGTVASDDIPGLTSEGSVYEAVNRRRLQNGKGKAENKLKDIFHDDFTVFADYIESLGFKPGESISRSIAKAGNHNGFEDTKNFYDSENPNKVNEALFAYYMAFHMTNNAYDDLNGGITSYKNVNDQVKRSGPQNTPKQLLNTNMMVGDHHVGSLQSVHPSITVYDWARDVQVTDKLKATIKAGTDGESYMFPLYALMFDISSGGREYSVGGAGSMLKTLLVQRDPIAGQTSLLKHATKIIRESDFNNSQAYRNMVMDGLAAQDQLLQEKGLDEIVKGTDYEGFSWTQRFKDYYAQTQSMDKATKMLFDDMIASQYVEGVGEQLYNALADSVVYGINPQSTRKNAVRAINAYDPDPASYRKPSAFGFETMDSTQLGIVLNSEQPIDDSKSQSPFQQQEAFLGVGDFKLTGELAALYGENAGLAVSKIRKEIYDLAKTAIDKEIARTVPEGVERQAGQPTFDKIDWMDPDIESDHRDLSYAMAQFEWYLRKVARSGMASASIQGNYVEMLSSSGITREIPQMRNKMVENYRKLLDKKAIKRGMTGMRTVQGSGMFHQLYTLKDGNDSMPFTRQEALDYLALEDRTMDDFAANDKVLAETFSVRGLNDMRVENGETKHGECIMPYIYAQKLGIRVKGVDGATRSESVRDLFKLDIDGVLVNVADMDYDQIMAELQDNELGAEFFDSFLIRRALKNIGFEVNQEMIDNVNKGNIAISDLVRAAVDIKRDVRKSLTVYANRVPSNRLGSGGFMDIVGFHYDGNEIYIPIGMTLLNDSDFDIDQLAIYVHKMSESGLLSTDEIDRLQSKIMDITEQVYMAKENQDNIFIKSSIDQLNDIGDEGNEYDPLLNSNSAYSLYKTYNDNKAGADGIGILANTLSATTWLQTIQKSQNMFLKGQDNPFKDIVDKRRVSIKGVDSLVTMVGDWLQAALDNNKYNTLGKYGITPEAVNIAAIMVAHGPQVVDGKKQTVDEFFRYIKDFFTNPTVAATFNDAAMGSSLHYSKKDHDLYLNVHQHLVNVENKLSKYSAEDLARDNKTDKETLMKYVRENLLGYINKYYQSIGGTMEIDMDGGKPNIDNFDKLVAEYVKSMDRSNGKEEQDKVNEYIRMTKYNKDVAQMKGFLSAKKYLTQLDGYIVQAEALRSMSNILGLRNGIPSMDSDILGKIESIQLAFGQDLQDIVNGKKASEDQFKLYYQSHSNEWTDNKDKQDRQKALLDKAVRVFGILDLGEILNAIPMMKMYVSQLLLDQRQMSRTFYVDSPQTKALAQEYMQRAGMNTWDYGSQRIAFQDALTEVALDKYFARHQQQPVTIATPVQSGNTFSMENGRFVDMDMSNVFDRQVFTLGMPDFVGSLQSRFSGPEEMEQYFTAMDPAYAGISDAFYDEDGRFSGNYFVNSLDQVGRGDRKFVGLSIATNTMSELKKRMLMQDFDRLPASVKNLFVMNELIVNKLGYRNGSIIDIIGLEPYRQGLSSEVQAFARSMRNGTALSDTTLRERFMDYVALNDGMTKNVSMQDIGLSAWEGSDKMSIKTGTPQYVTVGEELSESGYNRKTVYKQGEDGQYRALYLATGRAGLSLTQNPVTTLPTIALSAEEHDQMRANPDEPLVKAYPRGHNYSSGYYLTDGGDMVKLTPHGYEVTLRKINNLDDEGSDSTRTLEDLESMDQSGYDYSDADLYAKPVEELHDEDNTQLLCNL